MTISERILKVLKDRNMTQVEFAKQVGIATSTISEWKKKKTNPTADKIMDICNVLQITPEQLLTGKGIEDEEEIAAASPESSAAAIPPAQPLRPPVNAPISPRSSTARRTPSARQ